MKAAVDETARLAARRESVFERFQHLAETSNASGLHGIRAVAELKPRCWLRCDISETRDIAADHPPVVRELSGALERWQKTGRP
jgi:hypothetical protein